MNQDQEDLEDEEDDVPEVVVDPVPEVIFDDFDLVADDSTLANDEEEINLNVDQETGIDSVIDDDESIVFSFDDEEP